MPLWTRAGFRSDRFLEPFLDDIPLHHASKAAYAASILAIDLITDPPGRSQPGLTFILPDTQREFVTAPRSPGPFTPGSYALQALPSGYPKQAQSL